MKRLTLGFNTGFFKKHDKEPDHNKGVGTPAHIIADRNKVRHDIADVHMAYEFLMVTKNTIANWFSIA